MADTGRQNLTDKAKSAATPEDSKSYAQQGVDALKGGLDSLESTVQPESSKSTTQKVGDTVSGNSNENSSSLLGKGQNEAGSMANTAGGMAQGAYEAATNVASDVTGIGKK